MAEIRRKRGPVPKGDRRQFTMRLPVDHFATYREAAHDAGMSIGDYVMLALAEKHGLERPEYVDRPRRATGQSVLPLDRADWDSGPERISA